MYSLMFILDKQKYISLNFNSISIKFMIEKMIINLHRNMQKNTMSHNKATCICNIQITFIKIEYE